jgi:hypothetical protein
MDITKLKPLCVPVSEGLPSENGMYTVIVEGCVNAYIDYWDNDKWTVWPTNNVTHWLDLDLLTTKQRAIELAESAWNKGTHQFGNIFKTFITQNQNKL